MKKESKNEQEKNPKMKTEEITNKDTMEPVVSKDETKKKKEKEKKKKVKIEGGQITWGDVKQFFKAIWLFIKATLKFIFAPFWYTALLLIKEIKFLKTRGDYPLEERDKEALSLIPTFYFMLSISVTVIFVIFSRQLIDAFWSKLFSKEVGKGLGWFFTELGKGLAWFFVQIYYGLKWLWDGFIGLFSSHPFWAIIIIIVVLIVIPALVFLIYYAPFTQKAIAAIRRFIQNIKDVPTKIKKFFVDLHNKWKDFVLNKMIGERYLEEKSKNFFWTITLVQLIITAIIVAITLIQGISRLLGEWELADTLKFFAYVTGLLFLFIGILSTWFFVRILYLATKSSGRFSIEEASKQ